MLNNKYITLSERALALKNAPSVEIEDEKLENNSESLIPPVSAYMNERAMEFMEHFATPHQ